MFVACRGLSVDSTTVGRWRFFERATVDQATFVILSAVKYHFTIIFSRFGARDGNEGQGTACCQYRG